MTIDFKSVVPAAQAGDKAARDKLMAAFYAWSVTQARAIVHDSERAKDIAVDFWTWLYTEGGIIGYDPTKGAFYPWMESQLWYRALNAVKQKQPQIVYSEVSDPNSWDADPTSKIGALEDIETIADKLRGTQKDVFWLLLEGSTVEEIAAACSVSEKRARNMIGQVREAIRAQIGEG